MSKAGFQPNLRKYLSGAKMHENLPPEEIVMRSGLYGAAPDGRVYSCSKGPWRELRLIPGTTGYLKFNAYVARRAFSIRVHRFVWWYLQGPIPEGLVINHLDCDRQNNSLANLEVVTQRDNIFHAWLHARYLKPEGHGQGTRNGRAKLTESQVREIEFRATMLGESAGELAREFGMGLTAIRGIKNHQLWCHLWAP